jgi:hypothetical protein
MSHIAPPHWQAKLAPTKYRKARFHRTILLLATETSYFPAQNSGSRQKAPWAFDRAAGGDVAGVSHEGADMVEHRAKDPLEKISRPERIKKVEAGRKDSSRSRAPAM